MKSPPSTATPYPADRSTTPPGFPQWTPAPTPTGSTFLVPIEVKNVRHWLYPIHWEIYQLLHKAAGLANAHTEYPVLPILACRRAHYRTLELARDLGFLVFQTYDQYVQPSERIAADYFEEVRTELGLQDLRMTDSAAPALVKWLAGAPHRESTTYSDRWMNFSRHKVDTFAELRVPTTRRTRRFELLEGLHREVEEELGPAGSWSMSDHQPAID